MTAERRTQQRPTADTGSGEGEKNPLAGRMCLSAMAHSVAPLSEPALTAGLLNDCAKESECGGVYVDGSAVELLGAALVDP